MAINLCFGFHCIELAAERCDFLLLKTNVALSTLILLNNHQMLSVTKMLFFTIS